MQTTARKGGGTMVIRILALAVWTALAILLIVQYGPTTEVVLVLYASEEVLRRLARAARAGRRKGA